MSNKVSEIKNCIIHVKGGEDSPFQSLKEGETGCMADLNGYAIIPLTEYISLLARPYPEETMRKLRSAILYQQDSESLSQSSVSSNPLMKNCAITGEKRE